MSLVTFGWGESQACVAAEQHEEHNREYEWAHPREIDPKRSRQKTAKYTGETHNGHRAHGKHRAEKEYSHHDQFTLICSHCSGLVSRNDRQTTNTKLNAVLCLMPGQLMSDLSSLKHGSCQGLGFRRPSDREIICLISYLCRVEAEGKPEGPGQGRENERYRSHRPRYR